jgi:hypothetical protein
MRELLKAMAWLGWFQYRRTDTVGCADREVCRGQWFHNQLRFQAMRKEAIEFS